MSNQEILKDILQRCRAKCRKIKDKDVRYDFITSLMKLRGEPNTRKNRNTHTTILSKSISMVLNHQKKYATIATARLLDLIEEVEKSNEVKK